MSEEQDSIANEDSDDEFDWEEVEMPAHQPQEHQGFEITLQTRLKPDAVKNKGTSHADRLIRIDCHKIHTVALLTNARIRNKWINDPLLHARIMSLTPLHLQNAFATIHKSRIPDQNQRGRTFEAALRNLVEWWSTSFFVVEQGGHIRSRPFEEIQKQLEIRGLHVKDENDPDATINYDSLQDIVGDDGEQIRSPKSLMKHALMQSGSRDTSAQLFTALCRGMGIPARLVVSLQSVPWQAGVGKPKPTYQRKSKGKGKGKTGEGDVEEEIEDDAASTSGLDIKGKGKAKEFAGSGQRLDGAPVIEKSEKAKAKEKAKPVINLRKTKSKGQVLGSANSSRLPSPDPTTSPPVFWTEVFSRPDARWLPVDPIRGITNRRKVFDPSPAAQATTGDSTRKVKTKQENRMVYVMAFEEDGYARDVTRRYAREYGSKVAKVQGGSASGNGGKARHAWWSRVVDIVKRPYRLHRDDLEDEELETAQMMEGMPSTISGFKDHPLYVLTRHLKHNETIHPPPPSTPELGKFRGEPVYPRTSVVTLKTAEVWMRSEGRMVKEGVQALKLAKVRAGTVNKMRELEVLKEGLREAGGEGNQNDHGTGGEVMQGLYARFQTEPYIPDPIVDGKIPKNNFGNIDLYVPSMLPEGGVHVPFKRVAKIARNLGLDFAEAVTGFEFKKRRAFPIIEGVVIASENEAALLEAYWEAERAAEEKARIKREERVLKQWTRIVQGLRIRQRLQEQYASKPQETQASTSANTQRAGASSAAADGDDDLQIGEEAGASTDAHGSGFLVGADDVVQAFHLPKYTHVRLPSTPPPPGAVDKKDLELLEAESTPDYMTYDLEMMDVDDSDLLETTNDGGMQEEESRVPKTMQELAEDAARKLQAVIRDQDAETWTLRKNLDGGDGEYRPSPPPPPPANKNSHKITMPSSTTTGARVITRNGGATSNVKAKPKPKPKTRSTRAVTKKRARTREDSGADESDPVEEEKEKPSKRSRSAASKPTTPASTRTLRPRVSKTRAQIEEERENEEAYKRAVDEDDL